jgi:hypothetical protein
MIPVNPRNSSKYLPAMSLPPNDLTYEFHETLNPAVWVNGDLKPEIKEKLIEIAEAFLDSLDTEIEIEDVTLTGSLANYNYTRFSDFDLHIVVDFSQFNVATELVKDYFNTKKTLWNATRDITIKGYDVEVYVQELKEPHHSSGVYSLRRDEWITEPKPSKSKADVDPTQVQQKKLAMLDLINFALSDDCDVESAERAKEKFMQLRKAGLETAGELSPENMAFKELRRSGDVERLMQGIISKKDRKLSLDSVQENLEPFKSYMDAGQSKKRGPRHRSANFGVNKLNQVEKGIGVVADMHKIHELPVIHNLKKATTGFSRIPYSTAQSIATQYNLDWSVILNGTPRGLSDSGIQLGYDTAANVFYLRK